MIFTGKIALRKRGENGRSRKRLKKNDIINSFFLNNDFLFVSSLIPFFVPPLISPPLFLLISFFFAWFVNCSSLNPFF